MTASRNLRGHTRKSRFEKQLPDNRQGRYIVGYIDIAEQNVTKVHNILEKK